MFGDTGAGAAIDRSTLVSGTYNPVDYSGPPRLGGDYSTNRVGILTDPSNLTAAEPAGTQITYSTNGQVVKDTAFYRKVSVSGQNILFQNCIFYGTDGDAAPGLTCTSSQVGARFEDCTFTARTPQYGQYAGQVGLGGGTFLRCDVYNTDDGIVNSNGNRAGQGPMGWAQQWNFVQCAFHDFLYFSPYGTAPGGIDDNASHTDGIQWSGGYCYVEGCGIWAFFDMSKLSQAGEPEQGFGAGSTTDNTNQRPYHFMGNKYTDTINDSGDSRTPRATVGRPSVYSTSCMMISPPLTNILRFEMTQCYLDGTTQSINVSPEYWTTFGGFGGPFIFTNNKIGTRHRWALNGTHKAIIARSNLHASMTISGNTDLLTGAALTSSDLLSNG
jgi:hypothetical protein